MFIIYYPIYYLQEKNGTELVERYHTRGWSQQEANQTMVHKGTVEISRVSESQHTAALGLITTALYKVRVGFSRYETSACLKPWSQTVNGSVKHGSGFEKVLCFSSIRQGLGESFEVAPSQQKRFIWYQEKQSIIWATVTDCPMRDVDLVVYSFPKLPPYTLHLSLVFSFSIIFYKLSVFNISSSASWMHSSKIPHKSGKQSLGTCKEMIMKNSFLKVELSNFGA